jgi:hypothetical protein
MAENGDIIRYKFNSTLIRYCPDSLEKYINKCKQEPLQSLLTFVPKRKTA